MCSFGRYEDVGPSPLQEAYDSVTLDVELSRREGWYFAAKLVRGAYMDHERERAEHMGYDDPINPDYESTSRMYNRSDHRSSSVVPSSSYPDTMSTISNQLSCAICSKKSNDNNKQTNN